jgi:hypothetical protein
MNIVRKVLINSVAESGFYERMIGTIQTIDLMKQKQKEEQGINNRYFIEGGGYVMKSECTIINQEYNNGYCNFMKKWEKASGWHFKPY